MIHKETREEEVRIEKREVVVAVTCDLCKRRFENASPSTDETVAWTDNSKQRQETTVRLHDAEYDEYEYGGRSKTVVFDICPDCFADRLVPWLKEQGADPNTDKDFW
jgi:hypothetical protein